MCEMVCAVLSRFNCVQLFDLVDCRPQAPLPMEFSRQGYWSGLSCPPPGHLPDPGIKSASLMSSALADGLIGATWQASSLWYAAAAAAKSLQSCPTLCDPIDSSPLGSSVSGILQARILE